ncbi:MAG: glycosyltransferase, partial [Aquiluna sp.]
IESLAKTKEVTLTIAGEFWDDQAIYESQIARLGLESRVTIHAGYVPQDEFSELFGSHDFLAMPYRSGTGSIVRELAFRFGLPVIATDVGSIAEGITHDVNGLIIPPHSVDALTAALASAANLTTLARWKSAIGDQVQLQHNLWLQYCGVFLPDSDRSGVTNG